MTKLPAPSRANAVPELLGALHESILDGQYPKSTRDYMRALVYCPLLMTFPGKQRDRTRIDIEVHIHRWMATHQTVATLADYAEPSDETFEEYAGEALDMLMGWCHEDMAVESPIPAPEVPMAHVRIDVIDGCDGYTPDMFRVRR